MSSRKIPIVAIVGRPNVGKSSLFNALGSNSKAIVSDIAGTTRDNVTEKIYGQEIDYWLVDTAGLTNVKGETLEEEVQRQARLSLEHADMIVFVVDSKALPTLDDQEVAAILRRSKKPILFVANKVDDGQPQQALEWANLGFGVPESVSAKNNTNLWELSEALEKKLFKAGFKADEPEGPEVEDETIRVAFIGRPNVGKSSLLNALVKQERAVVSDVAGTTRDALDSEYTDEDGQKYRFIDTAGLRRRGKQKDIEFWSGVRTVRSIERSDVCVLLIDALDGVTHQDLVVASKVLETGKGLLIGVNKLDLVREKTQQMEETDERDLDEVKMWGEGLDKVREKFLAYLTKKLPFCSWAPVAFFSAKTGRGIQDIFPSLKAVRQEQQKRVSTSELNRFLPEIKYGHVAPSHGHKIGKIKYASQVDGTPPKFVFFVNNREAFHFSYRRYIENKLREKFGFHGTPITIELKDAMGNRREK